MLTAQNEKRPTVLKSSAAPGTGTADCNSIESTGQRLILRRAGYLIVEYNGVYYTFPEEMAPLLLSSVKARDHECVLGTATFEEAESFIESISTSYVISFCEVVNRHAIIQIANTYVAISLDSSPVCIETIVSTASECVSGETLEECRLLLLAETGGAFVATHRDPLQNQLIFHFRSRVFCVLPGAYRIDLLFADKSEYEHLLSGSSPEELHQQIEERFGITEVEFTGWLPSFEAFGDCGNHPQFGHVDEPPPKFKFVKSNRALIDYAGGSTARKYLIAGSRALRVGTAFLKRYVGCRLRGVSHENTKRFLADRGFKSQLRLPLRMELGFYTSLPVTYGSHPWVIEIEDLTTLFFPYIANGDTASFELREHPFFEPVRDLLEDSACKGIVTHIADTADCLRSLFQSEVISRKVHHVPMGVELSDRYQKHAGDGQVNLLFSNSWHQGKACFYLRGGLDVLEAYSALCEVHSNIRLTLRTKLPDDLPPRYRRIVNDCGVEVVDRFLPAEEFEQLKANTHIYLLPSARVHIVSLLQAMSCGMVPVVSDGWGYGEYVENGVNSMVVSGRFGKVAWSDLESGMLREDYSAMYRTDPMVSQGLVGAVDQLIRDPQLRARIGRRARQDIQLKFNLANWNSGLRTVLESALERSSHASQR